MPKARTALLLASALLLGACNQPSQTVTAPLPTPVAQPAALGLYELSISGANGQVTSVQVTPVGGTLSAQAISGLSFSAGAAATYTTATAKHLAVVVNVTNNSGAAITKPTYVPVAISNYTQEGTYFRNVKDSGGAPVTAVGLGVEQAYTDIGGVVQVDPAATPLITNLDTSGLTFTVPAGTSVTDISPKAWQSATLANGASQSVKFGVNVPTGNAAFSMNLVFGVFDSPATTGKVVISEFRFRGPSGAGDEFFELLNVGGAPININGWKLQALQGTSTTTYNTLSTLGDITLQPGQFYLVASGTFSLSTQSPRDVGSGTGVSDNRNLRIIDGGDAVQDLVGFAASTVCEGVCLANGPTTGVLNQISWARKVNSTTGQVQDSDNNAGDFEFRDPGANPQNSSTTFSGTN